MKTLKKAIFAAGGLLVLGFGAAKADSPDEVLIDTLQQEGVINQQQADKARAREADAYNSTAIDKISIGKYVSKLQFYGDARLRYENISQHTQYAGPSVTTDRERYLLRFGAIYTYSDNLSAGFELRSGTAGDTASQSFGGSFADAGINVSKIYLQYKPIDFLTLTAGKFTNPIYTTTDMVWANNLTPEGGAETLSYTFPLGGGSGPVKNDPKSIAASAGATSDSSLTVGLTSAQYIYVNDNESNYGTALAQNSNDTIIYENQIPVTWKIDKDLSATVAPGFTFYTGGGNTNYGGDVATGVGNTGTPAAPSLSFGTANSSTDPVFYSPNAFDYLNVVSAPGEVDYKLFGQNLRTYWDFNWNITARERIQHVFLGSGGPFAPGGGATGYGYDPGTSTTAAPTAAAVAAARKQNQELGDGVAWAIGEQIGENKKKGDWSVLGEFRQVGLGALDPNTNGTDWGNSYSNQQGFKVQGVYSFTDFLTFGVTYYNTWDYKDGLFKDLNAGSNAKPNAGSTQYLVSQSSSQRGQVDLTWKF